MNAVLKSPVAVKADTSLFDASRAHKKRELMIRAAKVERRRRRIDALNAKIGVLPDAIQLERMNIPVICGVYFLFSRGALIYVGQSTNVHGRLQQHRHAKTFDEFAFIRCDEDHLDVLESVYIHRLRPKLNSNAPLTTDQLDLMGVSCWLEHKEAA